MTLHIIKLFVGLDTLPELAAWQMRKLDERRQARDPAELYHITRHRPKRVAELLNGGSIYWIMKGRIAARQRLLDFRSIERDGVEHCLVVFDRELVTVEPYARRPFQGWRYLDGAGAPPDIGHFGVESEIPEGIRSSLAALGLL